MFDLFSEINLISPNQSCFRPCNSSINQLLLINHGTLSNFEIGLGIRGLFLDISRDFDKVWHAGLIYKLYQNGTCGCMGNTLIDFLINRRQRVVLYGVFLSCVNIRGGVPQGFIPGIFLFLI